MTVMTVVLGAATLVILGILLWSWVGQEAEVADLKRRLRDAEEPKRVLRDTTQQIWLHGKSGAQMRRFGTPALLVGMAAAAFGAGIVRPSGGEGTGEGTDSTSTRGRVDSLTARMEAADARREAEMKDLFNQMFRQRIATSIMLEEMNCVVDRVGRGIGEEPARVECRRVVSVRRDSLAQNP